MLRGGSRTGLASFPRGTFRRVNFEAELALSLWTTEAARSAVLGIRGHTGASTRVAGRARILATRCSELGVRLRPDFAGEHARWMGEVAGTAEQTGALGWFFLQRMGAYVDLHSEVVLPKGYWSRLVELGAPDAREVQEALSRDGIPPPPPPEWPEAPRASPPGNVHTRFGVIGDPHVGSTMGDRFLPAVVSELNRKGVDFSVAIGDLTQDGREELFHRIRGELDKLASELIRLPSSWWPRPDSNRHSGFPEADFKSAVSTVPPRGLAQAL